MADDDPYAQFGRKSSKDDDDPYAKFAPAKGRGGEAFGTGILNAATFNFRDELHGIARAGGLDPNDPDVGHAIASLVRGAYRRFKGDPEAERLYAEQRDKTRAETQQLEQEHPTASLLGNVAGAVALPLGVAARAPTMGARAIAAAKTGALTGGAAGFGAGEDFGGSLRSGVLGAGVGAATGAVLSPAVERAVEYGGRALQPVISRFQAMRDLDAAAQRRIGTVAEMDRMAQQRLEQEAQREAQRAAAGTPLQQQIAQQRVAEVEARRPLSMQEFQAAQAGGAPVVAADLLGESGRALARTAANISPEARAALEGATQDRYRSTLPRLSEWMQSRFHFPDPIRQQQALTASARTENRAAYQTAYSEGPQVWSSELERLTSAPEVIDAMRRAQQKAQSRAVVEGVHYSPLNSNAFVDDAGQLSFRSRNGAPTYPDLRFWDYTRRELSQEARKAYRAGANDDGEVFSGLARLMNTELDRLVPSYQAARQGAARFFGADDALEAGQNFFRGHRQYGRLEEAAAAKARMSPLERQLFEDGYAGRIIHEFQATGSGAARTNFLNRIENAPAARQELELGLGAGGAADMVARLRIENVMDRMRGALGNSTTARQWLEAAGIAGGGIGLDQFAGLHHGLSGVALIPLLKRGAGVVGARIDQRVLQRVGEMLASSNPQNVERGIQVVRSSRPLRETFAWLDNATARLAGQAAPLGMQQLTGP